MVAKLIRAFAVGLTLASFSFLSAHAQSASYTAAQAARGKALYQSQCSLCHGADLDGVGQNPPLSSSDFTNKWGALSVDDLFEKIQTTMPAIKPGSLTRDQTADLVSFILSFNHFAAGAKPLPTDAAALKKIPFPKK